MRISDLSRVGVLLALALAGPAPLLALDAKQPTAASPPAATAAAPSPFQAFRSGTELLKSNEKGDREKALTELRYAADQGHPLAQWKLGRMYADGDGVKRDHLQAFQYFSRVASDHAEASPGTAAGSLRLQRICFARQLLSERHPEYAGTGRHRPRVRAALLRGVVFRRR